MHFINDKANGRGSVLGIFTIHYTCTVLVYSTLLYFSYIVVQPAAVGVP